MAKKRKGLGKRFAKARKPGAPSAGSSPVIVMMASGPTRKERAKAYVGKKVAAVKKRKDQARDFLKGRNEKWSAKSFARRTVFAATGGIASSVVSTIASATANKYDDGIIVQSGARLVVAGVLEFLIPGENTRTFTAGWTGDGAGRAFDKGVSKLAGK